MYEKLREKLSSKKNYCKSKGEPLSICTFYDDSTDDVACEYYEEGMERKIDGKKVTCTWYYNSAHCKNIDAQEEARK